MVIDVQTIENVDDGDRRRRYTMEPQAAFDAFRAAQAAGRTVLGFFHSHTDGTTEPSPYDVAIAWPDKSYLIVGVHRGRVTGHRVWRLDADGKAMAEEELRLTSPQPLR